MSGKHKSRGQQKAKAQRFEQRYGMDRRAWRELKKTDPQKAHEKRMSLQDNQINFKTVARD